MVNRLELTGNELMVYAIIFGFCQDPTNPFYRGSGKYFADSLRVSRRTISTVLEELVKKGYIKKHDRFERGLKFCDYSIEPYFLPENDKNGGMENFSIGRKNLPRGGMENYSIPMQIFPKGMENFSEGMENSANHIDLNINLNTTTTGEKPPDLIEEAPASGETAAAAVLSPEEIKAALKAIDRALLLKDDFYPRAAAFMPRHCLDPGYFVWLYKQVELRNPDSFEGFYFTLFFAENMVEKYKISKLPEEKPPPSPPPEFKCPVCGTVHDKKDDECPLCSLPRDAPPERIVLHRELLALSPERRKEYLEKEDLLCNSFSLRTDGINKYKSMKKELNREFGIEAEYEESSRSYHS
jgi:hypothetical protein